MFCVSCGKEIEDDSLYCEHCGARQEESAPGASVPPPRPPIQGESGPSFDGSGQTSAGPGQVCGGPEQPFGAPGQSYGSPGQPFGVPGQTYGGPEQPIGGPAQTAAKPRKPLPLGARIGLIAAAAVVVLVVVIKVILTSVNDPVKTINRFAEAVSTQDAEQLMSVTTVADDQVELSEETLQPFFSAYSGDAGSIDSFQSKLTGDLEYLDKGQETPQSGFLRLVAYPNIFFTSYKVEITPIQATIYSEFDNTTVALAGQQRTVGTEGTPATLLPGAYTATASYTDPVTGVTLDAVVDSCTFSDRSDSMNVYFTYSSAYVEASTDAMELTGLWVDGKEYAGDLSQLDFYYGFRLSPVKEDSVIQVTASAYGLDFEKTLNMQEDHSLYMAPELSETLKQEAMTIGGDVGKAWAKIVCEYDQASSQRLAQTYGASSPDFVEDVANWLSGRISSAGDYTSIRRFTAGPNATEVEVADVSFSSDYISVRVDMVITGVQQYTYYNSGETYGNPRDEREDAYVYLRYVDGGWVVQSASY